MIYYIVPISVEQLSDSAIPIHILFFQILFHDGLSQVIDIVSCAINEGLFVWPWFSH